MENGGQIFEKIGDQKLLAWTPAALATRVPNNLFHFPPSSTIQSYKFYKKFRQIQGFHEDSISPDTETDSAPVSTSGEGEFFQALALSNKCKKSRGPNFRAETVFESDLKLCKITKNLLLNNLDFNQLCLKLFKNAFPDCKELEECAFHVLIITSTSRLNDPLNYFGVAENREELNSLNQQQLELEPHVEIILWSVPFYPYSKKLIFHSEQLQQFLSACMRMGQLILIATKQFNPLQTENVEEVQLLTLQEFENQELLQKMLQNSSKVTFFGEKSHDIILRKDIVDFGQSVISVRPSSEIYDDPKCTFKLPEQKSEMSNPQGELLSM